MIKFKCWRKEYPSGSYVQSVHYKTISGDRSLIVRKFRDEKKWDVFVTKPYEDLTKPIVDKKFIKRSTALHFANSYMKKHDKC